ncbi:TM2 domain-containing protein [Lactobacillus sp. LC28-10]|uniref:TM2 domain-containing protein n=1 Tax=Secundilactobacillus angelensis TaxID=2722706 RepID=A0ABX1L4B7_9LACO|nr:TM2 domain-containing protein [Secundilactobacillus angelensis]MCH5463233.1 TM2 domain-containing protein [Secundilactobacillus angelensis]NLR19161.1 TM2 domain-containing protein [Secundilactobacillus angelensis]
MNNQYYLSQLTNDELMLVNSEVQKRKKSAAVAYILCVLLGTLGGHRYYMNKIGSAIAMTLISVLTFGFGLIVTGIWTIVDLFLIAGWLQEDQNSVEEEAAKEVLSRRGMPNNNFAGQAGPYANQAYTSNVNGQPMGNPNSTNNNQDQNQY